MMKHLDHPEILRMARIAVKQYNRQQVNPKLGFWFASSAFKPHLYSSLPCTDCGKICDSTASFCDSCSLFENTQLEFVRLLKAYRQCTVGTLFWLTLEATDVGVKKTHFVKILRNASENCRLELESFQLVPNKIET